MIFKHWLRKNYKKDDGERLTKETVNLYNKAYKDVKKYVYRQYNVNLYKLSTSDLKNMLSRLQADEVFQQSANSQNKARAFELYIQFKDRK